MFNECLYIYIDPAKFYVRYLAQNNPKTKISVSMDTCTVDIKKLSEVRSTMLSMKT